MQIQMQTIYIFVGTFHTAFIEHIHRNDTYCDTEMEKLNKCPRYIGPYVQIRAFESCANKNGTILSFTSDITTDPIQS